MFIINAMLGIGYAWMFHLILTDQFPEKYPDFLTTVSYNLILFYSTCQIYIKTHVKLDIIDYLMDGYYNGFIKRGNVDVILSGAVFYNTTSQLIIDNPPTYFDCIIYSEPTAARVVNKIVYYNYPISLTYKPCSFSFISCNITICPGEGKDTSFALHFSNDRFNYYIVNNRINKYIIFYLMYIQHGIMFYEAEPYTYCLNIIDHNVNTCSITEMDEIVLDETTYTIRHLIEPCIDLKLSLSLSLDDITDNNDDRVVNIANDSDEYVNITTTATN